MIILEHPGVEMQLGPGVEQRRVDAHAVAAQGGQVVIAGHARGLARVGLEIADPHDPRGGAGERGGDGRQGAGGDHTGEQRAWGEQTQSARSIASTTAGATAGDSGSEAETADS